MKEGLNIMPKPNDWISHEIKKAIDLTKIDEKFFRGGLALPVIDGKEIEMEIDFEPTRYCKKCKMITFWISPVQCGICQDEEHAQS